MLIRVNKQEVELPSGSSGRDLAEKLNLRGPDQSLAMRINGTLRDLSTVLHEGDEVALLSFDEPEGKELFWHTSAHVLAQAILRLWPKAEPTIGPPIEKGFYYDFANLRSPMPILKKSRKRWKRSSVKITAQNATSFWKKRGARAI